MYKPSSFCRAEKVEAQNLLSDDEVARIMELFENECQSFTHGSCKCCHRASMNISVDSNGYCTQKCSKLRNKNFFLIKNALPIWRDGDKVMHSVPVELCDLSIAEKMLIQKVSPMVPLYHLKYGIMGMTGHCCAFESDIAGWVNTLPRQKNDVTMLRVLRKIRSEITGKDTDYEIKAFRIRKSKIGAALRWLQLHNSEYKQCQIDMSALDWLAGEEGNLNGIIIDTDEILTSADDTPQNCDLGPAPMQATPPSGNDVVGTFGYVDESTKPPISEKDEATTNLLRDSVEKVNCKKTLSVDWPNQQPKAIEEYKTKRLFECAFPWLFPGGIGGPTDYPGTLNEWGKHMLYYSDGRFAKDSIFPFFAQNYVTRMRNASHGNWFINDFCKGLPDTLDEVKARIESGDMSFINNLSYYNRNITGSSPYWFKKRCELYQWVNHHVEIGNGAPSMFITLSCAEYLWADVIDKIKERMEIAGQDSSECFIGSTKLYGIVNDYAIVVQEYFQKRVTKWLETVGKEIFGIKHYWVRYEFAPGRGQIHAHLLAIPDNHDIYEHCHKDLDKENAKELRAIKLAQWAKDHLGLTASVNDGFEALHPQNNSHVAMRFKDVKDIPEMNEEDFQMLLKEVQVHTCNGFCMREKDKR